MREYFGSRTTKTYNAGSKVEQTDTEEVKRKGSNKRGRPRFIKASSLTPGHISTPRLRLKKISIPWPQSPEQWNKKGKK